MCAATFVALILCRKAKRNQKKKKSRKERISGNEMLLNEMYSLPYQKKKNKTKQKKNTPNIDILASQTMRH